jgi:4-hydroxy-tetrahydrodipicolinate synthase
MPHVERRGCRARPPEGRPIQGIVTVLNTPFRADNGLDTGGLEVHVAYARDAGVAGFLVNGLAAEVDFLTPGERETILRTVVASAGDVPVIAGLGSAAGPKVPRAAARYLALGSTGLLVNGADVQQDTLLSVLLELDRLKPRILMLQDWDATGAGVPVPALLRLVERVPSLRWLKIEVVNAGPKYSKLIAQGPESLHVAGGWAVREMIDALERGVHAFMPTALHRTYVRIHELHLANRREQARALFERVLPILEFSNQRLDVSIAFFKRLLHAQGVFETERCRMPTARLDSSQSRRADELIELAIALEMEQIDPKHPNSL